MQELYVERVYVLFLALIGFRVIGLKKEHHLCIASEKPAPRRVQHSRGEHALPHAMQGIVLP